MTTSNLIPGHGRNPGSLNKTTKERTLAFREKLEQSNVLFKALNLIIWNLENHPEDIKVADLLKITQTYAPYLVLNASAEQLADEIRSIKSTEDAARIAAGLVERLKTVRG